MHLTIYYIITSLFLRCSASIPEPSKDVRRLDISPLPRENRNPIFHRVPEDKLTRSNGHHAARAPLRDLSRQTSSSKRANNQPTIVRTTATQWHVQRGGLVGLTDLYELLANGAAKIRREYTFTAPIPQILQYNYPLDDGRNMQLVLWTDRQMVPKYEGTKIVALTYRDAYEGFLGLLALLPSELQGDTQSFFGNVYSVGGRIWGYYWVEVVEV